MDFDAARSQFPVLERYAYLNAGTNGPLPRSAVDAMERKLAQDRDEGRSGLPYIEEYIAQRQRLREAFAAVLATSPELVALTDSTTRGCQTVLAGLDLGPEDEVVTTAADEDALLAAVTPRTRLVAVSHVLWTTGRKLDLARLRLPDGPPLLVDGAQSAGAIPPDL